MGAFDTSRLPTHVTVCVQVGDILVGLQGREFVDYQDAIGQIRQCCQSAPLKPVVFTVKHAPGCLGSAAAGESNVDANHSAAESKDNNGELPPWACPACTFLNEGLSTVCGVCETSRPPPPPSPPRSTRGHGAADRRARTSAAVAAANAVGSAVAEKPGDVGAPKAGGEATGLVEGASESASEIVRADSEGAASASEHDSEVDWHCLSCTQLNEGWRSQCSACLTARVGAAPASVALLPTNQPSLELVANPSSLDVAAEYDEEMFQGIDFSPPSCPPPADTPVANMEDELQSQLTRLSVYNLHDYAS